MAAPHPEPTQLKALKGTGRKDRQPKNALVVDPISEVPSAPDHFNEVAVKIWDKAVKLLHAKKILSEVDMPALQAYCFDAAMIIEAEIELSKPGGKVMPMEDRQGNSRMVKSPWIEIRNKSIVNVNALGSKFGFTPSDRAKISMPEKEKPNDPLAELQKRAEMKKAK